MTKPKSDVIWCDRGWQPVYFGFCPDEAAWKRAVKRLGCSGEQYPTEAGRCTSFEKDGKLCILVTVADGTEKHHSQIEVTGLLVHEATHVWQYVRDHMGEKEPSVEFEAYAMQAIFQGLMSGWEQTRGKKRARRHK